MSLYSSLRTDILPAVGKELGIRNPMAIPAPVKVIVSVGIGSRVRDKKDYSDVEANLAKITGQKAKVVLSRKAVSNFKLREGTPNALVVTLRGRRMMDFIERLTRVALPRVRDFRGISRKAFDVQGNYGIGLREHSVFPECVVDDLSKVHGLSIVIATTARSAKEGEVLLRHLGFPLQK